MVVCEGTEILPEHLPAPLRLASGMPDAIGHQTVASQLSTLEQLERAHIQAALQSASGHRGKAAKILGISERNLYRKLREHQLLN